MKKYLTEFINHTAYEAVESGLTLPNVSYCVEENDVYYKELEEDDYSQKYFTLIAIEEGDLSFSGESGNFPFAYSTNGGKTWETLGKLENSISLRPRSKILLRGTNLTIGREGIGAFSYTRQDIGGISANQKFELEGNIMSLIYGDDFANSNELSSGAFYGLFYQC